MHIPPYYKNTNLDEVRQFIIANSFGILVSSVDGRPWATHIPVELHQLDNGEFILEGHVSRGNKQWKQFAQNEEVMVIFNGPHTYVSSSWYDHENVPTWNYVAVHVYGKLRSLEGEALLPQLKRLVDKYEAGSKHPVSLDTMSKDLIYRELRGIVGFEIDITDIQAAYKLSQNRDAQNHAKVMEELTARDLPGDHDVVSYMKKYGHK